MVDFEPSVRCDAAPLLWSAEMNEDRWARSLLRVKSTKQCWTAECDLAAERLVNVWPGTAGHPPSPCPRCSAARLKALWLFSLQADKRAHHNALERKRRDHIKDSFHSLRDSVPSLQGEKVGNPQPVSLPTTQITNRHSWMNNHWIWMNCILPCLC